MDDHSEQTPTADIVRAPFSGEQVRSLNYYQAAEVMHPFTCGHDGATLVATQLGWHCPVDGCVYQQDWAHRWMANWDWTKLPDPRKRICSKCKQERRLDEFGFVRRGRNAGKRVAACKKCMSERVKDYRANNGRPATERRVQLARGIALRQLRIMHSDDFDALYAKARADLGLPPLHTRKKEACDAG